MEAGCNHITCPVCKCQWCWLCRDIIDSSNHFLSSVTCKGKKQSEKNLSNKKVEVKDNSDTILVKEPLLTPFYTTNPEKKDIINVNACCDSFVDSEFLCRPPLRCCRTFYATFIYFFCLFSFALKVRYIRKVVNIRITIKKCTKAIVNVFSVFIRLILLFPYMIPGFIFAVLYFFWNLVWNKKSDNFLLNMCAQINKKEKKLMI